MSKTLLIRVIFLVAVFFAVPDLYAGEIAVVVNESGPLTNISMEEVRDIYLGNIRFAGNVRVMPLNYREGAVKEAFLSLVVGMRPKEYRRYWVTKSFQEGIILPLPKTGYHEIITQLRRTPGAIGYLPKSELRDTAGLWIIATFKMAEP